MKKIVGRWIFFGLVVIAISILFISKDREHIITGNPDIDCIISREDIKADRDDMVKIMESTHPIFLDEVPKVYYDAKAEFLKNTNKKMTLGEFRIEISKYLSSIDDGHTSIGWVGAEFLDINWKYIDKKLTLLDKDNKPTKKFVTSINNVNIEDILKVIDKIFPKENYVDEYMNNSSLSKEKLVLCSAGVDVSDDIVLRVNDGENEEEIKVEFINYNKGGNNLSNDIYINDLGNKTVYIRFGFCEDNYYISKINTYLRENLDDIKHVIIDVRDNPGGDSTAFEKILQALDIKSGNFGGITRVSDIATKFYPYLNSMEYKEFERYNNVIKNENIELYVIMNESSFSSAQWVATLVKDGELGTLLGKPSRNRPSSFGNSPSFELAKTKLMGQISITKWLRPDASKDQEETIEPDIIVEDWQDPLEKTLKLIESKEDLSNM